MTNRPPYEDKPISLPALIVVLAIALWIVAGIFRIF